MLELRDVSKTYTTGDFTQVALDDISIAFRDSEFVAVLGPSGSGKTTMLNIVGGLDHYDSGNLVIDGIETSRYKDSDWDAFRNNRIGFVFQAYNLIPHQTILSNVELALTLAGVSRAERRRRARSALEEVGLGDHIHKRPSQLSGGQMQRVAIARALVNDPEILLADEPTGALDSTTSVQIMGLLTSIAKDRLVVMVTHNPELAQQYATRIVELRDGVIASDSDPFTPPAAGERVGRPARRTSMSFPTAIALSFNNLMTKKGRTLMTSFAGSIGIIGIAAILSLANGVNAYIKGVEQDTLSLYPLSIQRQGVDISSLLTASGGLMEETKPTGTDATSGSAHEVQTMASMFGSVGTNDLASLKRFLDADGGGVADHVRAIEYSYDVSPRIFAADTSGGARQLNPDTTFSSIGFGGGGSASALFGASSGTAVFSELNEDLSTVDKSYDVLAGRWPTGADEAVLVLTPNGGVNDLTLYAMGLRDHKELDKMLKEVAEKDDIHVPSNPGDYSYETLMGAKFKTVNATDLYRYDKEFDVWKDRSSDKSFMKKLVSAGTDLHITGVVKANGDNAQLQPGIYYTRALTKRVIEQAQDSAIVKEQLAHPKVDVFTGKKFGEQEKDQKADLSSLFSFDEGALAKAFTFDKSKLALDPSALSGSLSGMGIDMSKVTIDPAKLPQLDVASILGKLDLSKVVDLDVVADQGSASTAPDPAAIASAIRGLTDSYVSWAAAAGVDPADAASLPAFLAAPEGKAALTASGMDEATVSKVLAGYVTYAVANTLDPTDVATVLPAFLASADGQDLLTGIVTEQATQAVAADDSLAGRIVAGYLEYAQHKGLDPADVSTNLPKFLATDAGAALLRQAGGVINTDALNAQLQPVLAGYMGEVMKAYSADLSQQLGAAMSTQIGEALRNAMAQLTSNMSSAMKIDPAAFQSAFKLNRNADDLSQLLSSMVSTQPSTKDGNLQKLGYADLADPSGISLYPLDFESKAEVITALDNYNSAAKAAGNDDQVITYTDLVGALMSSVTSIINTISYVLVAFVAISLVVSSIMIGVITYISVLERKKEIGILRSVGARKRDIRRVFNAETMIVGFVAGVIGVGLTALLTLPVNAVVQSLFGVAGVAILPWQAAVILVAISVGLTAVAGLMPASAASRKDPVEALRSE